MRDLLSPWAATTDPLVARGQHFLCRSARNEWRGVTCVGQTSCGRRAIRVGAIHDISLMDARQRRPMVVARRQDQRTRCAVRERQDLPSLRRAAPLGDLPHLVLESGDPRLRPGLRFPGNGVAPGVRFGELLDAGSRHERANVCVGQQEQALLQERAPGLANARVPQPALAGGHRDREITAAFRHASPEAEAFTGLKTGRFVHAFRFIFAVDLLVRPAPPNVAPISCRAITGSPHAEPSGRSKNTGAPLPSPSSGRASPARRSSAPRHSSRCCSGLRSPCWMNTARSVSASKCMRCRARSSPSGSFVMASSTSPQRHPWSRSAPSTMTRRLASGWNVARYERLARGPSPDIGSAGQSRQSIVIG